MNDPTHDRYMFTVIMRSEEDTISPFTDFVGNGSSGEAVRINPYAFQLVPIFHS